ncbi:MAG: phospholipid carrier-dependent glycosyltransferase [Pyrinomonadaceae bacterium]
MNRILAIFTILTVISAMLATFPDGVAGVLVVVVVSFAVIALLRRTDRDNHFLINIFLTALIARILFGSFIHIFEMRDFFGADAATYDFLGNRLVEVWTGQVSVNDWLSQRALATSGAGWGMTYLVAFIYLIVGHNILAAQFFCAVIGAATAPLVYICSHKIFQNHRVGKISALLVALFPGFIIWSSQLLKDGLIIFLLVLSMTMVLELQKKFSYPAVGILILSLFGILSLRFYIFYMVAIAVAGSFIIGASGSAKSVMRGFIALVIVGIAMSYLGVFQTAGTDFEKFGSLERVQISRQGLATTAESGYGEDIDVSTTGGAISILPIGFSYLMFAPFPWQVTNFRQAITLPEMMVWWSLIPLLLSGLWYTIKNRLRNAISILIFTLLLTIAYSIFQGNVGTAYRQRAQIQVFLFIFIAVGWTLWQEKKENRKMMRKK